MRLHHPPPTFPVRAPHRSLDSLREEGGHLTVFADTEEAFVQPTHWDGKRFLPVTPGAPPVLTFFGSGTFGYAVPAEAATGDAAADAPL